MQVIIPQGLHYFHFISFILIKLIRGFALDTLQKTFSDRIACIVLIPQTAMIFKNGMRVQHFFRLLSELVSVKLFVMPSVKHTSVKIHQKQT